MNPQKPIDSDLEEYLQDRSVLSRVYKATTDENPPDELDTAILARARRAADGKVSVTRSPFTRSWMIPASLAAVLILTVGVVTFFFEETGVPLSPKVAPESDFEPMLEEKPAQRRDALIESEPAAKPVDQSVPLKRKQRAAAPAAAGAPPPQRSTAEVPAEQKSSALKGGAETGTQDLSRPGTSRANAPEEPAAIQGLIQTENQMLKEEAEVLKTQLEQEGRARRELTDLDAASESDLSPEEWLQRIISLRKQGKHAEADAALTAFKKRYPNYPVEKSLIN